MDQNNLPPKLDSLSPLSSHALPNTIPPKPKTGRGVYIIWYLGFISLILAALYCFAVVVPDLVQGQIYVAVIAFLLTVTLGSLFLVLKKIIDIYNRRP